MNDQQLTGFVQELAAMFGQTRQQLARLEERVADLEATEQRHYQTHAELSAHLNGMTYP